MMNAKETLESLKRRVEILAEATGLSVTLEIEDEDQWEIPGGMLVVDNGLVVAWVYVPEPGPGGFSTGAQAAVYVDDTKDTSDPSVGLFVCFEPRTWHTGDEPEHFSLGRSGAAPDETVIAILLRVRRAEMEYALRAFVEMECEND